VRGELCQDVPVQLGFGNNRSSENMIRSSTLFNTKYTYDKIISIL